MYNGNYGGLDYVRTHSELQELVINRNLVNLTP